MVFMTRIPIRESPAFITTKTAHFLLFIQQKKDNGDMNAEELLDQITGMCDHGVFMEEEQEADLCMGE